MPIPVSLKKGRFLKLFLVFFAVILLAVIFLSLYENRSGSIPRKDFESLKSFYREEFVKLKEMNEELSLRLAQLQGKIAELARERDSLQEDKSRMLFMLEKLEKQANVLHSASTAEDSIEKFARSWLLRISELKNEYVKEGTAARDALISEVNEIIRGLKEDFSGDAVIGKINYCRVTSSVKKDMDDAKKKLAAISAHLREYYPLSDD